MTCRTSQFVHNLSVPKQNLRVAHHDRVNTCGVLSCCLQVVCQPLVVHLASIPLTAVKTKWSVAKHALYCLLTILLNLECCYCNVTTLVCLVVRVEERCCQLQFTSRVTISIFCSNAIQAYTNCITQLTSNIATHRYLEEIFLIGLVKSQLVQEIPFIFE